MMTLYERRPEQTFEDYKMVPTAIKFNLELCIGTVTSILNKIDENQLYI